MVSINDVLKASKGLHVDDIFAELWGRKLSGGYTIDVYTGTLPAVLTGTKAGYLHKYKIYGNTEQTGTPTPSDPIYPSECGELETTGVHAGQYKLPLSSAGQSVDIYLGESQATRRIGKFDLSQATWSLTGVAGLFKTTAIPNIKYTSSNLELGNGLAEKYQIHTGSGMSTAVNCIAIDTAQVSVNTGSNSIKPTGIFYYALATPETSVVNEPLRKIGDYADTIDSTQTSAQIPTSAGSTTISWAGEGLAPSQVEFEYERRR